ncbi:MAG: hypothetical protein K2X86_13170 [Cytophagaceae bacterium]|nr:hypothetical protein [Cytophagaceae bacterium]
MARQNGILKIKGTIGGMTFYKSQDGHLVREKGGVDGERIANDPAFIRTRENGQEFGNAGTSGKILRDAIRIMMMTASDSRVTSRLTKLMMDILKQDSVSARGERNVGVGISTPEGNGLLNGFNFNIKAILGSILFKPYTLDTATGEIGIAGLVPINDIVAPVGATHVSLRSAFANVDFASGISAVNFSPSISLAIDGVSTGIALIPQGGAPAGTGTNIYLLQIEFFQEVNGQLYSLKNGAYNALAIVEVNNGAPVV